MTSSAATPGAGDGIAGYGTPAVRRMRDTALIGALAAKHIVTAHEFQILRASWSSPRVRELDDRLFRLLAERVAPSRLNADEDCFDAFSSEEGTADLIRECLRGLLPASRIDVTAMAGAAAAHGRLRVKAVNHAA